MENKNMLNEELLSKVSGGNDGNVVTPGNWYKMTGKRAETLSGGIRIDEYFYCKSVLANGKFLFGKYRHSVSSMLEHTTYVEDVEMTADGLELTFCPKGL